MSIIPMRTHLQLSKHPTGSLISHRRFLQMADSHNRRCHYVRAHITASKKVIEGVSDELNLAASQNMDFGLTRRRVRRSFLPVQQQLDHVLFKMAAPEIQMEEKYEMSSKGVEIFWKSWRPPPGVTTKAALFFCHGYGDTCTFFFEGIAKMIAKAGYGVYAMDYPSFGLSEGLHGYIHSFDEMVDQVIEQYARIRGMEELRGLPHFLLGQSMGGAVALKVHLKQPREWDGVVLVAPMCKIAEDVTPPAPILKALAIISNFLPEAKLFPQKDLAELAFRIPLKRKLTAFNVIAYSDQMRLRTAVELIQATRDIESQLEKVIAVTFGHTLEGSLYEPSKTLSKHSQTFWKVSSPLLILHGAADKVTDPQVSKYLYNKSCSKDKTLKLYEESYHSILEGEPDDRILEVINDIISWLDSHSTLK